MAQRGDIPLGGVDAFELLQKKEADRAARAAAKGKAPAACSPSARPQRAKKRVVEDTSPGWTGDGIVVKFSSSASSCSEFAPHYEEASKLLWPEDEAHFRERGLVPSGHSGVQHVFQGMQTLLFLTKEVEALDTQLASLKLERSRSRKEVSALQAQKEEMSKTITELQAQLRTFTSDASQLQAVRAEAESLRAEVESLRAEVIDADDRAVISALRAEIKLRAEMLDAFRKGMTQTWIAEADKAIEARDKLFGQEDPTDGSVGIHDYDADGGPHLDFSALLGDGPTADLEDGRLEQGD